MANRDPIYDARLDDTLAASFPASDPPSWTLGAPEWASSSATRATREEAVLRRLHGDHANLSDLALVLESLLARLHAGETIDRALVVDIVVYVTEYLERFHERRERWVFETILAPIPLARALQPAATACAAAVTAALDTLNGEFERHDPTPIGIVREGFAYTRALRKRIAFEDSLVLPLARLASVSGDRTIALGPAGGDDRQPFEGHFRALFDALTERIGCGCAFEDE